MKTSVYNILTILLLLATACGKENKGLNGEPLAKNQISFRTFIQEDDLVRPITADQKTPTNTLSDKDPLANGYIIKAITTTQDYPALPHQQIMQNVAINQDGTYKSPDTKYFWHVGNASMRHSFFAYSEATTGNEGTVEFNTANNPNVALKYTQSDDPKKQRDLLTSGNSTNFIPTIYAPSVDLIFKHALARVKFKLVGTGGITLTQCQATITYATNTCKKGTADIKYDGKDVTFGNYTSTAYHTGKYTLQANTITLPSNATTGDDAVELGSMILTPNQNLPEGWATLTLTYTPDGATAPLTATVSLPPLTLKNESGLQYEFLLNISVDKQTLSIRTVTLGPWNDKIAAIDPNTPVPPDPSQEVPIKANSVMVLPGNQVAFDMGDRYFRSKDLYDSKWKLGTEYTPIVIWTDVPNIIASTSYDKNAGKVLIATAASNGFGNAVVGLFPKGTTEPSRGECLWSWHVWVTDYNPDATQKYNLGADSKADVTGGEVHTYGVQYKNTYRDQVMMDRNLGATVATYAPPADEATGLKTFGLLYQWGRKDPIPGWSGLPRSDYSGTIYGADGNPLPAEATSSSDPATTGVRRIIVTATGVISPTTGTSLEYAIKNPLTIIYPYSYPRVPPADWYTTTESKQNNGLWGDGVAKSVYDPCPEGWRVPKNGTWNDFGTKERVFVPPFNYYMNGGLITTYPQTWTTSTRNGRLYEAGSVKAWYPAAGVRGAQDGSIVANGRGGRCWSSTISGANALHLYYNDVYGPQPSISEGRGYSNLVRCVQE